LYGAINAQAFYTALSLFKTLLDTGISKQYINELLLDRIPNRTILSAFHEFQITPYYILDLKGVVEPSKTKKPAIPADEKEKKARVKRQIKLLHAMKIAITKERLARAPVSTKQNVTKYVNDFRYEGGLVDHLPEIVFLTYPELIWKDVP
jgi:hypothetical protein